MEQMEKYRKEEAKRLIEWIKGNNSKWYDITIAFTEDDGLVASECKNIIKCLRNNGFYQLIVLLLFTKNVMIQKSLETSILSYIDENWNQEFLDKIIDMLLDNITDN